MARRRRRRMNGCAKCSIALVVIIVIFMGALYGGGMFAWGKFAQEQTGITYNEALSLVGGLYSGKESKVVAKADKYTEADLDAFYTGLEDALFLDENSKIKESFSEVLLELINKKEDTSSTEVATVAAVEGEPAQGEETTTTGSITGNETVDNFLKGLNFDFSKLKDYEDEFTTPHVLSITGKQLAAFLNDALADIMASDLIKSKLPQSAGPIDLTKIDLTKAVRIPQIVIKNKDLVDASKISLKMTIALELRDVAKQALQAINPSLGFVSMLIPKTLYVSATVYPSDPTQPAEIDINAFNDKRKGALESLLDKVMENTEYGSFTGLMEQINTIVIESLEKVQQVVPICFVDSGSLEAKPIKALMSALKITELTETQFFCMIRDICLPTFNDIKTNLNFEENFEYAAIDSRINTELDKFILKAEEKYAIEEGYLKKETLYKQLTTVNSDNPEEESLKDHINTSQLALSSPEYIAADHKLPMTYVAFAGLINSYLVENPIATDGLNVQFNVINGYYDQSKTTLSLVIEIDLLNAIKEKLNEDSLAYTFISQLVPENIYIIANINLSDSTTTIEINGNSVEQTTEHLDTLISISNSVGLNMESFNYEELTNKIGTAINDGLAKVESELGAEIIFRNQDALLPNIYEVLAAIALKEAAPGGEVIQADEMYFVMQNITTQMPANFTEASGKIGLDVELSEEEHEINKTNAVESFITEFTTEYAVDNSTNLITSQNVYERLTTISTNNEIINKINMAELPEYNTANYIASEYKVQTGYLALTKLLGDYIDANETAQAGTLNKENYDLVNVMYDSVNNEISLIIKVNLFTLITLDPNSTLYSIAQSVLPDAIFLKVSVKLEKVYNETTMKEEVVCDVYVVGLDTLEESQLFLNRIIKLGNAVGADLSAFTYDSLTSKLGNNVFDGIDSLKTKMGVDIVFDEEACYIPSLYEIMANKIVYVEGDANLTDEEVFNVFKKLKSIPANYATSNKAEDVSSFVEQVNTKYFINPTKYITVPTQETDASVINQLTALSTSYDNAIMGSELASAWSQGINAIIAAGQTVNATTKQYLMKESFSPIATEGELANLFSGAVTVEANGLENLNIESVYIENNAQIRIIFSCDYVQSTESTSYSAIVPKFVINVLLDITKINSTTEDCCVVTINNLNTQAGGELEDFGLMCSRLSTTAFSITDMTSKCNDTIKTNLKDLFNKISLKLEPAQGKAYVGSIYEAAYNTIGDDTFTAIDVADTISALHTPLTAKGQIESEYTGVATPETNLTAGGLQVVGSITGQNLGSVISEKGYEDIATNLGIPKTDISIFQTAMISTSATDYAAERDALLSTISNYSFSSSADYAIATLAINTGNIGYSSSLLPSQLFVTAIINLSNADAAIMYNNLNATELNVLNKLSSGSSTTLNAEEATTTIKNYILGLEIMKITYGGISYGITLQDVINANAGEMVASINNGKINGSYKVDYTLTI